MNHLLPETATLLAVYLRDATGNQRLFARLILADSDESCDPDGNDYIKVGVLEGADEHELFNLFPPHLLGDDWSLGEIVYLPGTRSEPPSSDVAEILATRSLPDILGRMAEIIFRNQLANAQLCFEDDHNTLRNDRL